MLFLLIISDKKTAWSDLVPSYVMSLFIEVIMNLKVSTCVLPVCNLFFELLPVWHSSMVLFFLPETTLSFMRAKASITFITLELKLFTRSLPGTEGRAVVGVKAEVNNVEVFC